MTELIANGTLRGAEKTGSQTAAQIIYSQLEDFEEKTKISKVEIVPEKSDAIILEQEQMKGEDQTWTVGAHCQAVWSEDSKVYTATIISIDGDQCRVKFDGYGNEEDMPLSALKTLDVIPKNTQVECNLQEWKPGSLCRATYSADGLTYPAVVLWVKGERCRVQFDDYNNEEEMDVSSLLGPDELNGPGRVGKSGIWRAGCAVGGRRRREDPQDKRDQERERGGRDRHWKDQQQNTAPPREKQKDTDDKKPADKLTSQMFSFFPPFPPPNSQGDMPAFIPPPPPPPPVWAFGGKDGGLDSFSNMLMLWYMCGFHTGSYLAQQQFKSSSRD